MQQLRLFESTVLSKVKNTINVFAAVPDEQLFSWADTLSAHEESEGVFESSVAELDRRGLLAPGIIEDSMEKDDMEIVDSGSKDPAKRDEQQEIANAVKRHPSARKLGGGVVITATAEDGVVHKPTDSEAEVIDITTRDSRK